MGYGNGGYEEDKWHHARHGFRCPFAVNQKEDSEQKGEGPDTWIETVPREHDVTLYDKQRSQRRQGRALEVAQEETVQ